MVLPESDLLEVIRSSSTLSENILSDQDTNHQYGAADDFVCMTRGYHIMRRLLQDDEGSPIQAVPMSFFRKYGLGIWDRRRLYILGLDTEPCEPNDWHNIERSADYFFRWRSILSKIGVVGRDESGKERGGCSISREE